MSTSLTEAESLYNDLEKMPTRQILESINQEDRKVADAVAVAIPAIEKLVTNLSEKMKNGGRLFYIGAGTSGRIGILDAAECPPTFGVSMDTVIGFIAGGDRALREGLEGAEDSLTAAWETLQSHNITQNDFVIGIAASGRTPYVIGGLQTCRANGIATGCVVCNPGSPVAAQADYPVEVLVGPEFVTGSTRMKAGTAQKLVLNMITTTAMIHLGKVEGNRMVHMQLRNEKLVGRGTDMVVAQTSLAYEAAQALLLEHGSVKKAVDAFKAQNQKAAS